MYYVTLILFHNKSFWAKNMHKNSSLTLFFDKNYHFF